MSESEKLDYGRELDLEGQPAARVLPTLAAHLELQVNLLLQLEMGSKRVDEVSSADLRGLM